MSSAEARDKLERVVRDLCQEEAWQDAATTALRGYGGEILGYLSAVAGSESLAEEAFSTFCEDLWRGLPGFGWRSSLRTWCYVVARNAHTRVRSSEGRRNRREVRLGTQTAAEKLADEMLQSTFERMREEYSAAAVRLRSQLPEDEQTILILRVDRRMEWLEIAEVFAGPGDEDLRVLAARMRKRFQRVKERLRKAAIDEGLISK